MKLNPFVIVQAFEASFNLIGNHKSFQRGYISSLVRLEDDKPLKNLSGCMLCGYYFNLALRKRIKFATIVIDGVLSRSCG